ncbi:hypothetical protein [Candidatus Methylobacter oryzae]|uniref:Uncharacterized protein n=1 Tax=Candidatus Methylobacter oryzae TaxID=2497749 RepID=A0ABY3C9A1_9GAMM|nr:hypothetical protein [Candidatus Methylobacter oryzae]TRW93316.1 hypothetical protein EKO24_012755 [Candidatus Methylobacter oryzae]
MKGIVKNKTFSSESIAQAWAEKIEQSIKTIPYMDQTQLLALSETDIDSMGGEDLFKQLGVDLFSLRNQAQLEAINALSKKELLQLSPQEIERMGGAELFLQAGKGELMNLRWCDVNFKDNIGYLGDTKNGTSRELHFAPVVIHVRDTLTICMIC